MKRPLFDDTRTRLPRSGRFVGIFCQIPVSLCLRILKVAQELERLEKMAKADRRDMLTVTRERRIDQ